jgi:signal transduction histidine kinase
MNQNNQTQFNLNTGTDLALALVVFITYFTTFSNSPDVTLPKVAVIIFLGIAYITNGIYGFTHAKKSGSFKAKFIYLSSQLIIGGMIVFFGKGTGFNTLILLPIVAHTAMLLDQDWSLIANAAILLIYGLAIFAYSRQISEVWHGLPLFFAGQVFILIFTQMAVTEQKARQKLEILAGELSAANKQLSDYVEQVQTLSIAKERNRMAREIHDGLGHYLTTINMQIKAADAILDKNPLNARKILETAQQLTSEALIDVRNSVYALRQDSLDLQELPSRITKLIEISKNDQQNIIFRQIGEKRDVSPEIDVTLFRGAQETLNNAQKHSNASTINIFLDYSNPGLIVLETKDNGVGVDQITPGFGLLGIEERVKLLKGNVSVKSDTGTGFIIRIELPG